MLEMGCLPSGGQPVLYSSDMAFGFIKKIISSLTGSGKKQSQPQNKQGGKHKNGKGRQQQKPQQNQQEAAENPAGTEAYGR